MVRAVGMLARETNCDEALKQDLTGKLTSVKIMMQRQSDEDVVQAMAETVIALSKFVLGHEPISEDRVEKKHLREAMWGLKRRWADCQDAEPTIVRPTPYCAHCGEGAEQHGPGSTHYFEPEPEMELQHGGELREKEPIIEDKTNEDIGLDPDRWKLITDLGGYPVLALAFDGTEAGTRDTLSQEQVEEIEAAVLPIIQRWGR